MREARQIAEEMTDCESEVAMAALLQEMEENADYREIIGHWEKVNSSGEVMDEDVFGGLPEDHSLFDARMAAESFIASFDEWLETQMDNE